MNAHTHDMKICLAMFEKLSEYIDNELDELTCRDIERHARECIRCHTCLETLKRTIDLCRKSGDRSVPETFSLRLKEVIQSLS
ncbi:MAG: zf-HC2 domain-containing protein [Thermodesulfobacteriota bacterium]